MKIIINKKYIIKILENNNNKITSLNKIIKIL